MKKLTNFPTTELTQNDTIYVTIAARLEASTIDFNKESTKLRSLLNDARDQVEEKCEGDTKKVLLERLEEARANTKELVSHKGALIMYATPDEIYYYHLGQTSDQFAAVSELPHLKPLVENFQYSNEFDVLALNQGAIRFFQGNAVSLEEVDLDEFEDAPSTMEDALGTEKTGGNLSHSSASEIGGYHGHKETSNEKDIDRTNYFRNVDKFIYDNFSSQNEKPLILYALTENQAVFRKISKNDFLLDEGIEESASGLDLPTIEEKTTSFNQKVVEAEQAELINLFNETSPEFKIENIWSDLAASALEGKISELVIQEDFEQDGTIDENGRYVEEGNLFLTQLVTLVLQNNGQVYVVHEDDMPEEIHVSARLRY